MHEHASANDRSHAVKWGYQSKMRTHTIEIFSFGIASHNDFWLWFCWWLLVIFRSPVYSFFFQSDPHTHAWSHSVSIAISHCESCFIALCESHRIWKAHIVTSRMRDRNTERTRVNLSLGLAMCHFLNGKSFYHLDNLTHARWNTFQLTIFVCDIRTEYWSWSSSFARLCVLFALVLAFAFNSFWQRENVSRSKTIEKHTKYNR